MMGLALVLFMAGVQKIPQSLYDAARVDGAGMWHEFFAVTLPNLRGEIAVALTLMTIAALRNFDLIYITTQGRPRHEHDRAGVGGLQPRVPDRPHRLGRRDRRHARLHDLRDQLPDHPRRRSGQRDDRRGARALLNYAILIVFSLFALYPVVGVLTTALADPGTASGFRLSTDFHFGRTSPTRGRRATSRSTSARA